MPSSTTDSLLPTGATPAKNAANAAVVLRNALTACYTLVCTWHTLLHYPHGANAGCDLAGVAPVLLPTQISMCLSPYRIHTQAGPSVWCNSNLQWRCSVASGGCPKHDDALPTDGGAVDVLKSARASRRSAKMIPRSKKTPCDGTHWEATSSLTN